MKIIKKITRAMVIDSKRLFILLSHAVFMGVLLFSLFCTVGYAEPVFSVKSDNEPFNEVLTRISRSTGYKIEITKGYRNPPVTVQLKKIALEKGLREIMRVIEEPNYAIVVYDNIKKVEIRIFGEAAPGQKSGKSAHAGAGYDFRSRTKAASELVDVSRERAEAPEEPPEDQESEPIEPPHPPEPPEIEIIPPE